MTPVRVLLFFAVCGHIAPQAHAGGWWGVKKTTAYRDASCNQLYPEIAVSRLGGAIDPTLNTATERKCIQDATLVEATAVEASCAPFEGACRAADAMWFTINTECVQSTSGEICPGGTSGAGAASGVAVAQSFLLVVLATAL